MKYDFLLFENFHSAFHHKYDVYLMARLLKSKGMKVAILNVYGEDKPDDYKDIDLLELPFRDAIPDDRGWLDNHQSSVKRLCHVLRFLVQQNAYMKRVRSFIEDKANAFYFGSYHLLMPATFLSFSKPCYYWGLRSYRMTGFWQTIKYNPFLAFRMFSLKHKFLKNHSQGLFVSNAIIKEEFINLGVPENRLIIREERCIEKKQEFRLETKDDIFSLLVIGGIRKQKHIDISIRAFKSASLKDSVLRVVGENQDFDYEKIIINEISGCPYVERVNKRLQYEDFNNYMRKAHFVLFADERQQSSVTNGTMMESIINYTPIIAPNYEPYSYYIHKYGIGLTYEPGDIEDYARTLVLAKTVNYSKLVKKIKEFQKTIEFDQVATQLYDAVMKRNIELGPK